MSGTVVVVSPEELRALIRAEMRAALEENASTRNTSADDAAREWLDAKACAELLDVSTRQVAKLAAQRAIPSSRVGKLLRFRRADVIAYLERDEA